MELQDYEAKTFFTPFELEHILQIPMSDVMALFSKVSKVKEPRGCFEGEASRALIEKWARKRVYADIIGRSAVNAHPEIKRAEDEGKPLEIGLLDTSNGHRFTVRFPGDLRGYLDEWTPPCEEVPSEESADSPAPVDVEP